MTAQICWTEEENCLLVAHCSAKTPHLLAEVSPASLHLQESQSGSFLSESSSPTTCLTPTSGARRWKWNEALSTRFALQRVLLRERESSTKTGNLTAPLIPHQKWNPQWHHCSCRACKHLQAHLWVPSYLQFHLISSRFCLRQRGSPTFILRNTTYSHVPNFSLPTLPLDTVTLQPFFIFPPEEAVFTPAQNLQLTRVQAASLYLCITSKAFIWQAVSKLPACYINLHFSLHSPLLISVWECINMGLSHKVCIWACLMFGGAELAPEPGEESPLPHVAAESKSIAVIPHYRIPSSAWIYSHGDFFPLLSQL